MKRLICRLWGHRWEEMGVPDPIRRFCRVCRRCRKVEVDGVDFIGFDYPPTTIGFDYSPTTSNASNAEIDITK